MGYTFRMLRYIQQLSALAFYALGSSFFVAYVLLRNALFGAWPALWMQTADMPLALAALLYGGTSFYLSLRPKSKVHSTFLAMTIAIPLVAFFTLMVLLKYWAQ